MADYYPLIARAVAGLDNNAGENRRALYERARTALIAQLRGVEPALSESDITRERLALEEAIRKVEAEAAQRARSEPAKTDGAPRSRAGDAVRNAGARSPPPGLREPARSGNQTPERPERYTPQREERERPPAKPARAPGSLGEPPSAARERASTGRRENERPSLAEQSLRGFRDVVADAGELGRAAAQANRSARKTFAEVPSPSPEFERLEPSMETRGVEPFQDQRPFGYDEQPPEAERYRSTARPRPPAASDTSSRGGRFGAVPKIAAAAAVLLIVIGLVISQWPRISSLVKSLGTSAPQTAQAPRDTAPATSPKITDRVGQPGSQPIAPVAQRVVLYEEDPAEPQGKQSIGSVVWRTESVPGTGNQPPDLAIRADIELPDRKMKVSLSIRRNTDLSLPASHTAELTFTLPPNFTGGAVANVPGVLMKSAEQTRGTPLAGLAVKVTDGFFLIGLSNVETDRQRNVQMLKERPWFDIPIVYTNQRRAILAVEKGAPGERAFQDAFAAWGQ